MNRIKLAGETNQIALDLAEVSEIATAAETDLRTLKELEIGWVAGGDGMPVWPY